VLCRDFFDVVVRTSDDARGNHFTNALCSLDTGLNCRIDGPDVTFHHRSDQTRTDVLITDQLDVDQALLSSCYLPLLGNFVVSDNLADVVVWTSDDQRGHDFTDALGRLHA